MVLEEVAQSRVYTQIRGTPGEGPVRPRGDARIRQGGLGVRAAGRAGRGVLRRELCSDCCCRPSGLRVGEIEGQGGTWRGEGSCLHAG
eukprot:gene19793-biopygen5526